MEILLLPHLPVSGLVTLKEDVGGVQADHFSTFHPELQNVTDMADISVFEGWGKR